MRFHTLFFALVVAALFGCASDHFTTGRGDVGQFILQQAIVRGGSPVTTNLPPIDGAWRYATDQYGVVIRMSREEFPSVEQYLRQAFGKPGFGPTDTSDGGKLGEYRLTPKGGGIQFVSHTNWTQVTIIRPMSQHEWDTKIMPQAIKTMSE